MSGVFISYRRDDCPGHAGRLYDRLAAQLGRDRVFIDVDSIEPGVDFGDRLAEAVGACGMLIALIGTGWVNATDRDGRRRLDDPADFVRLEIVSGLARSGLRVIPVRVEGAQMPRAEELPPDLKPLARRNALELSHSRWDYDVSRLIEIADRVAGPASPQPSSPRSESTTQGRRLSGALRRPSPPLLGMGAAIALAAVVAVALALLVGEPGEGDRPAVVTKAIGKSPGRLTVAGGFVWVPLGGESAIARVDPVTLDVKRIGGFAEFPASVSADPDGDVAGIWVADSGANAVVRVDPDSGKLGKPIGVGVEPNDIAVGEGFVWTADCDCEAPDDGPFFVSRIDPETGTVRRIDVAGRPLGVGTGNSFAWVASAVEGTVQMIEPRSGEVVGHPIRVGDTPSDIVVDSSGVWVALNGDGEVARIDPITRKVDARLRAGPEPYTLAAGGGFLWVIDERDGLLRRISLRTAKLVGVPLKVGRLGKGVAFGEGRAWATAVPGKDSDAMGTLRGLAAP